MKNAYAIALVAASWLSLTGCSGPTQMVPAKVAPFSEGTVDASYSSSGNGDVVVKVKNLGDPAKLDKAATTYVVWITPDGTNSAQNSGAFKVDDDGEGELEFKTSFKKFKVVVTAESKADVSSQSSHTVLSADVVAD
jgi:hypothetical protein